MLSMIRCFLATELLAIKPDIEQGIYPFKDMKLARADIEWLLANHEKGQRPVDWSDEHQQERLGLDLRRADLRQVNLQRLPRSLLFLPAMDIGRCAAWCGISSSSSGSHSPTMSLDSFRSSPRMPLSTA